MPIHRLTPTQASAYRALMLQAYALHPEAFTSSVTERSVLPLAWWQARLSESDAANDLVFGAFEGYELRGAAGLSFDTREKARHKATLFGMYVPTQFQGHGLGRQLVEAVLSYARSRAGVKLVQLTVTQGNAPAQTLYASCGFEVFGTEPMAVAVGDHFVNKVHMWCKLGA